VDVEINGNVVRLGISKRIEVTPKIVGVFKNVIHLWETDSKTIAEKTAEFLQQFLPGKKVEPRELGLWNIKLHLDDSSARIPQSAVLLYTVGGDYADPAYDLIQFNNESNVELILQIVNGDVLINNCDFDVVNDF
jgi:hypothetical protein